MAIIKQRMLIRGVERGSVIESSIDAVKQGAGGRYYANQ